METQFEVIIVGGSYAGLSAALTLGRSLRGVLVIDEGKACNRNVDVTHNFLTRDGESPAALQLIARQQLALYAGVQLVSDRVVHISGALGAFETITRENGTFTAARLLFATGMKDIFPDIVGFSDCWGVSALYCPYCHGFELSQRPTAVLANGNAAFELTKTLTNWSQELMLFTNGLSTLDRGQTDQLLDMGVEIVEDTLRELVHENGELQHIVTNDGVVYPKTVLYAYLPIQQHCDLPVVLGCELTEKGLIWVNEERETTVEGVYAAGDAASVTRSIAKAVSDGSVVGMCINKALIEN